MSKYSLLYTLLPLGLMLPAASKAQRIPDPYVIPSCMYPVLQAYQAEAGSLGWLNAGVLFEGYPFPFHAGSPYFLSAVSQKGSLNYYGTHYIQVPLTLDLVQDALLYDGPNGQIRLSKEEVSGFEIAGHRFARMMVPADAGGSGEPSYYEILWQGPLQLLKKQRKKIVSETSVQEGTQRLVIADSSYFLVLKEKYYSVRSEKDLLHLLKRRGYLFHSSTVPQADKANKEWRMLDILSRIIPMGR